MDLELKISNLEFTRQGYKPIIASFWAVLLSTYIDNQLFIIFNTHNYPNIFGFLPFVDF